MKIKKVKATNELVGQLVFDLEPNKLIPPVLFEVMAIDEEDNQIVLRPISETKDYYIVNGYVYFPLNRSWYLVK